MTVWKTPLVVHTRATVKLTREYNSVAFALRFCSTIIRPRESDNSDATDALLNLHRYGHYRNEATAAVKHHWWWLQNYLWDVFPLTQVSTQ
jgi:hypothetical protein